MPHVMCALYPPSNSRVGAEDKQNFGAKEAGGLEKRTPLLGKSHPNAKQEQENPSQTKQTGRKPWPRVTTNLLHRLL